MLSPLTTGLQHHSARAYQRINLWSPSAIWPDYECTEHGGAGWEADVISSNQAFSVLEFVSARTDEDTPFERVRLQNSVLRELPPPRG